MCFLALPKKPLLSYKPIFFPSFPLLHYHVNYLFITPRNKKKVLIVHTFPTFLVTSLSRILSGPHFPLHRMSLFYSLPPALFLSASLFYSLTYCNFYFFTPITLLPQASYFCLSTSPSIPPRVPSLFYFLTLSPASPLVSLAATGLFHSIKPGVLPLLLRLIMKGAPTSRSPSRTRLSIGGIAHLYRCQSPFLITIV